MRTDRGRFGLVVYVASVEVVANCTAWWSGNHWDVLPEKFLIPEGHSSCAIHSDHVLVELADLNNGARLVPFFGLRACLVLDSHAVTDEQSWRAV